jgi:hypothetical protein
VTINRRTSNRRAAKDIAAISGRLWNQAADELERLSNL